MAIWGPLRGKQKRMFKSCGAHKKTLASGAVRTGKSVGVNFYFLMILLSLPKGPTDCIAIGRTLGALERNVLVPLSQFVGQANYDYNRSKKIVTIFGRQFWVEGANNESAYERIQGPTFRVVLCDEAALWPESFWNMLQTRLSMRDSQLLATFNPGSPNNYIKKKWIDQADRLDLNVWHFNLSRRDNPYLSQSYIDEIKQSFTGLFYKRYVEGLWVLADGAIFRMLTDLAHRRPVPNRQPLGMMVGVDIGWTHPTAFTKAYIYPGPQVVTVAEYRESDRTPPRIIQDLQKFIGKEYPSAVLIPPEEPAIIRMAQDAGILNVRPANNEVIPGISRGASLLATGNAWFTPNCPLIYEEAEGYYWDPQAQERGIDKPLKQNDDLLDSWRYIINEVVT